MNLYHLGQNTTLQNISNNLTSEPLKYSEVVEIASITGKQIF